MRKVNRETPEADINFVVNSSEQREITRIVNRACAMAQAHGWTYERMDAEMDIKACHLNGNPLRLVELAEADDFNFAYDVFGIRKHLNRGNGKLDGLFSPRFSAKEEV